LVLVAARRARPRVDGGDAEGDGLGAVGGLLVHLGELEFGGGLGDTQTLDVAEPAVFFGLGDAIFEVFDDLMQAVDLCGVGAKQGTSHAVKASSVTTWGKSSHC